MSIIEVADAWTGSGELHFCEPMLSSNSRARKVYLSSEVNELLTGAVADMSQWRAKLQAQLDSFMDGDVIPACLVPHKAARAFMGLLHPVDKGIWDIRCRDPSPGLRVLGAFLAVDVFVCLTYRTRDQLGQRADPRWEDAINECNRLWKILFPSFAPLTGDNLSDFLSANFVGTGNS